MQGSIARSTLRFPPAQEPFRHPRVSLNGSGVRQHRATAQINTEEPADF
jgi:hypothetical protein